MAESTERHKRESAAQAAQAVGGTSRESIRKAGIVCKTFVDGREALMSGQESVDALYRLAKGDQRVGINILVAPWLRDAINKAARGAGMTRQEYLSDLLTQVFG